MSVEKVSKENAETYAQMYKEGYGLKYPESHIIRFHLKVLVNQFGITGGKIFDYGCGIGTHLKYFADNGFEPFGCDTTKEAVEDCKKLMPEFKDNFKCIPPVPSLKNHFEESNLSGFDVVFSNQTLYYLNDKDVGNLTNQLYEITKDGGIFFASMMAKTNYSYKNIADWSEGLAKVVLKGKRLTQTTYVNFKTQEELETLFEPFKKVFIGNYGSWIREDEGPTDHNFFIGRKEK